MISSCLATVDFNSSTVFCNSELALRTYFRLVPKSTVRQTNSNKSNACGRRLFRRVHISDVGAVIDTSLAVDSLPDTDISAAIDVRTRRTSQACVIVTADVENESVSTDGRVVVAFDIAG